MLQWESPILLRVSRGNGVMKEDQLRMKHDEWSQDIVFPLLSHVYRRTLLSCLDHHGVSLTLADAAEEVARECKGESIPDIPDEEIKRIYMSLYHSHIPQLAEANAVTYDQEQDLIALTEQGKQLVAIQNRLTLYVN